VGHAYNQPGPIAGVGNEATVSQGIRGAEQHLGRHQQQAESGSESDSRS
jgi:hypothetical protein